MKLIFLASMLVASLMLSACNDTVPTDQVQVEVADTTGTTERAASAGATTTDTIEQIMSDNLSRYNWMLATAVDSNNQPLNTLMAIKEQVILRFDQQQSQNTLNYSVGCNTIGASYQLQGQTLTTKDSMSTKMSCGELDAAETRLNELMQGDSKLTLEEGDVATLTQVTTDATTLVWSGQLTAQAKYNSKGETIFLAVSADSKPCLDNQAQMCLQVRPITYDEQGIKTAEGELVEFNGTIDGYQHDSTQDEILRLQRYQTNNDTVLVDAKDSSYAYVLDTVIESSVAK